jgi:hypothetical protein
MWSVYLELFAIPTVMLLWVLYRFFIKKKPLREVLPDLQLVLFVCGFWYLVYFVLLR